MSDTPDDKETSKEPEAPKGKRGSHARVNIINAGENGEVHEYEPGDKLPAWLVERIRSEGRAEKLLA